MLVLRMLRVLRRVVLRVLVLPWLLLVPLRRIGRLEAPLLLLLSREACGLLRGVGAGRSGMWRRQLLKRGLR